MSIENHDQDESPPYLAGRVLGAVISLCLLAVALGMLLDWLAVAAK